MIMVGWECRKINKTEEFQKKERESEGKRGFKAAVEKTEPGRFGERTQAPSLSIKLNFFSFQSDLA